MKKKWLSFLILFMLLLGLTGCGEKDGKPENMNQDIYNYGVKAVEIVDSYLEADITAQEAEEKIDTLQQSAESISSDAQEDSSVVTSISLFHVKFRKISYDSLDDSVSDTDISELRDERNSLKETLNMQ